MSTKKTTKLYDVCNDYSLGLCEDQDKDLSEYRTKKRKDGSILYIHKEYNELHYIRKFEDNDESD